MDILQGFVKESLPIHKQIVIAQPEIKNHTIDEDTEFLVLASDGESKLIDLIIMNSSNTFRNCYSCRHLGCSQQPGSSFIYSKRNQQRLESGGGGKKSNPTLSILYTRRQDCRNNWIQKPTNK